MFPYAFFRRWYSEREGGFGSNVSKMISFFEEVHCYEDTLYSKVGGGKTSPFHLLISLGIGKWKKSCFCLFVFFWLGLGGVSVGTVFVCVCVCVRRVTYCPLGIRYAPIRWCCDLSVPTALVPATSFCWFNSPIRGFYVFFCFFFALPVWDAFVCAYSFPPGKE